LTRFFICLVLAAAIYVGATLALVESDLITALPSFFYQTLLLVSFGTGLIFVYLFNANKSEFFIQLYLLTTLVKILAYGVFSFIMIMDDPAGALENVVWFFMLYGTFTALEIFFLHRKIFRG
jgi:hypothetical protein